MTSCQRCGAEAELGQCPGPCNRHLCLSCYDGDQEETGGKQKCRQAPIEQRDDAIRALRGGGMSRNEVAERFGLSTMTISRVTHGG